MVAPQPQLNDRLSDLVASLLTKLVPGPGAQKPDLKQDFVHLSRLVDRAVTSGLVPSVTPNIVQLFRLVCLVKEDVSLRPAIMVLLLSLKSASSAGWFQAADAEELLASFHTFTAYFVEDNHSSSSPELPINAGAQDTTEVINQISDRYLPWLKVSSVILSVDVKLGYEVLLRDFNVPPLGSNQERLRLFVFPKNTETSSCLVSPPHANILVNGRGLEKRTVISTDSGPQVPTDVTHFVRQGLNVLQVIGDFPDAYTIAIAITSTLKSGRMFKLPEYTMPRPEAGTANSAVATDDEDVIECASRVSLRCPISHKRISTPVKGALCKHHQCFDYDSFLEINKRRPAWRCPYCTTPVSFPDLRLDVQMAKVLKDTTVNVVDVMVFPDGSWEAAPPDRGDATPFVSIARISATGVTCSSPSLPYPVIDMSTESDEPASSDREVVNEAIDWKPVVSSVPWSFDSAALRPGSVATDGWVSNSLAMVACGSEIFGEVVVSSPALGTGIGALGEDARVMFGIEEHVRAHYHGEGSAPGMSFFPSGSSTSAAAAAMAHCPLPGEMPSSRESDAGLGSSDTLYQQDWATSSLGSPMGLARAESTFALSGSGAIHPFHEPGSVPSVSETELVQDNGSPRIGPRTLSLQEGAYVEPMQLAHPDWHMVGVSSPTSTGT